MTIKDRILSVEAQMRAVVLEGAEKRGSVKLHTHHADGYWTVTVHGDGHTTYEGYAAASRDRNFGSVDELKLWELAMLLEELSAS